MADLTSLGVKFGYAVEATAGTRPVSGYIQVPRCASIGGINLTPEQIDVSCLEDLISKYADGRADTGGTWETSFHTDAITALGTLLTSAATAKAAKKGVWFVVWIPGLTKSFFVKAAVPSKVAMGELGQNAPIEIPLSLTIEEYLGLETAVEPTAA